MQTFEKFGCLYMYIYILVDSPVKYINVSYCASLP
jgi:hypothetical protein